MSTFTITGGAGFIGSHLADALLIAGHQVRVLDDLSTGRLENLDQRCQVIRGDAGDPHLARRALLGVDGCFHLAAVASVARSNEDWIGTHRVNQGATVAVLDAARALGGLPVVYASSAAVYGDVAGVADERTAPSPLTAYGADKLGSELHARAGFLVHRVPSAGFRFFNVYGPRQDPDSPYSGVISIFAKALAAGKPVTIHGDGAQTRDLIFVGDVVEHLLAGMRRLVARPESLVLNACTGRETSVVGIAQAIAELIGRPASIRHGPARAGDIRRSVGSPALARSLLGLEAQVRLPEGLAATLAGLAGEARLARA